jgi:hypothetical protein
MHKYVNDIKTFTYVEGGRALEQFDEEKQAQHIVELNQLPERSFLLVTTDKLRDELSNQ